MKQLLVLILCSVLVLPALVQAQDADALLQRVKARLDKVADYKAAGLLKTEVPFLMVPESKVEVYYKNPDQFRIVKQDGIAIVPKGNMTVNLSALFANSKYTAVPAGNATVNGTPVVVIKLLPLDDQGDVVLSTLYIDETQALVKKASTTTRDNGTYEMELTYGKYAAWGLPDKVVFTFNTKEFKLPKGMTFEYDSGSKPATSDASKNNKGQVIITYTSYVINKGLDDKLFK